jgi:hypothetical protein
VYYAPLVKMLDRGENSADNQENGLLGKALLIRGDENVLGRPQIKHGKPELYAAITTVNDFYRLDDA